MAASLPIPLFALAGYTTGSGMRMLDPLLPLLAADLGVTVAGATGVVAGFVLPYGLVQLAAGPLGDAFGKIRIACFALLLYGLGLIGSAFATDLPMLIALRAFCGCFAGAVIPLLMAHIGDSFPYEERQVAIGRFTTGMVMAQLVTGPVSGVLAEAAGWRLPFLVLGLLSLAVGGLVAWRLAAALWRGPAAGAEAAGRGLRGYAELLRRPAGRWLLGVAFFDGFLLFGGAFPYVGSFLIEGFGRNAAEAGVIVAGFGLGAFAYTRLARRLLRRFGGSGGCWAWAAAAWPWRWRRWPWPPPGRW
ncbi:MFS transporter [Siccirubricoccus sp. G192]|uniref:MFS transporter n=1 Tax=Siccirubricoccus sp. G192 TaxID=2849651 RepID=UPI001C2BAEDF|nr:MFS transporter [Siccirubricoccus sp. G192]MBV1797482.1 MFS transporter [Siccirubricoccus sp. G192]